MNSAEFQKAADQVLAWVEDYLRNSEQYPVVSGVKPGDVRAGLPDSAPETAEPFETVFQDFRDKILPGVTHWNHPGFFAYFAISGSPPGVLGEILSAALNINGMLWKTSPAATELEEVTLDWLRKMLGFRNSMFGCIMDTASVGSLCAMAAARESLRLGIREKGLAGRTDLPKLIVYTSQHSHSSIEKGAITLGFGRESVRQIGVDAEFRMRPDLLEQAIKSDLDAGARPTCVVATVGTTSTSSIDPVHEISEICRRYNVWLHVDAAYAGSAAILPEQQKILNGCENADSFLFNPHKWLFVPFDCTAFYTKHPQILSDAFSILPEYLRTKEENIVNLMDYGIQLGRRFRALKLWFVIRLYGVKGLQEMLRKHISMAQHFARWVEGAKEFELMAPAPFSLVCFRAHPPGFSGDLNALNMSLLERVNGSGEVYLSHTRLNDQITLRLAIGNYRTEQRHVDRAAEILERELRALAGEPGASGNGEKGRG